MQHKVDRVKAAIVSSTKKVSKLLLYKTTKVIKKIGFTFHT